MPALQNQEVVNIPGGQITLTHYRDVFNIAPGNSPPVTITTQKGFVHQGVFVAHGEPEVRELDENELDALVATTNNQTLGAVRLRELFQIARRIR
jgi:hypothetical protein